MASQQVFNETTLDIIKDQERLFLLSNIVKNYPKLLRSASPWQLSEDLLQLFDALFLQSITLPENESDMQALLAQAYQVDQQKFTALDFEANIIITLWKAWQTELRERNLIDEKVLFASQLAEHIKTVGSQQHWYILFLSDAFNEVETQWLTSLANKANVHLISPNNSNISSDKAAFIQQALYPDRHDEKQALQPAKESIGVIPCNSFENEAQQVLQQLRYFHSIKQANERIILLCEDRSLVRRLRALLEQHQISLIDPFGWSLVTTRAATFLNAILECAEHNYPYDALLELMKSPFAENVIDINSAYRFEHDIVRSENIRTNINTYKRALQKRSQRLGAWTAEEKHKLQTSLHIIEEACSPLQTLILSKHINAKKLLSTLIDSLNILQSNNILEADPAGKVLLDTLLSMHETVTKYSAQLPINDFKAWLLRELNDSYLVSQEKHDDISLVNLKQSQGFSPDYLVIANASYKKLPNLKNNLQFFNQRVCHELGLPTYKEQINFHKQWFFELLSRSKQCVISWQAEKNGESQLPSTWVTAISNRYNKAYQEALPNLYNSIEIPTNDTGFAAQTMQASVSNYTNLLPTDISVSAHQTLIDCPYEFFVSRLLGLKTTDEIKDKLQKNDFGSLVHQSIQAFHTDMEFVPGPFELPLLKQHRDAAISMLVTISKKLFATHTTDNYQDNSWLKSWLAFIPTFIDWEIAEYQHWQHKNSELSLSKSITDGMSLSGKIDRVDKQVTEPENIRLLDYKTGLLPTEKSIQNGESIQLTSYSLFLNHVKQVRYIGIDDQGKINDRRYIEDNDLDELREKTFSRLQQMLQQLHEGKPIPIWPEEDKCKKCSVAGICRNNVWRTDTNNTALNQ